MGMLREDRRSTHILDLMFFFVLLLLCIGWSMRRMRIARTLCATEEKENNNDSASIFYFFSDVFFSLARQL